METPTKFYHMNGPLYADDFLFNTKYFYLTVRIMKSQILFFLKLFRNTYLSYFIK